MFDHHVVPDDPASHPPNGLPHRGEDEHPPAAHPEVPAVADQRVEDVGPQHDQREPHHALQDRIDAGGEGPAELDGPQAEEEHHQRVAQRVQGGEEHGSPVGLLRAGDVGDGGDVIPVDPVPESEAEHGGDQSDPEPLGGGGRDHVHGPMLAHCCGLLQLSPLAGRVARDRPREPPELQTEPRCAAPTTRTRSPRDS